jgi:RNA polymerase sigma-70 factor, ECF subfamily
LTKGSSVDEPEPAVIRAAIAGDVDAFERLVRQFQPSVWRFLRHLLDDAALAEDVTQETFLRLYQHLLGFGFRCKFSTWVFRVARNAGIDALRSRERHDRLAPRRACADTGTGTDARDACGGAGRGSEPQPQAARGPALDRGAGPQLPGGGQVLGAPVGTIKSRVFQARERLAAWRAEGGQAGEL